MRRSTLFALVAGIGLAAWWISSRASENVFEPGAPDISQGFDMGSMNISPDGVQAIKDREGFSEYSYGDASGKSIGYGHFIRPGETFAEPMAEIDASDLLFRDLAWAENAVRSNVVVPLTQNQFDALVSFVYNVGPQAFAGSTLLALLNSNDYAGAAEQFSRWNKSQGKELATLIERRAAEAAQFMSG